MFAKKNLVAAAALMALVGAAQADVKVYGSVEAGFGSYENAHVKGGASTRTTQVSSGNMMTSFIGFSGSEDLGGGLKAEFALESFLAPDTGSNLPNLAGGFWGRGSFVALNGGFGKLALGQYDNPLFTSGYTYNPFGSSMAFSPTMRHLYSGGSLATDGFAAVGFDTGFVNSITYETPNLGGFSAIAQFAPKETASSVAGTQNSYSVGATYAAGPFGASLTYVKGGQGLNSAYTADQKVVDFGTSYDFGVVKLFGQYTSVKTKSVFVPAAGVTPAVFVGGLDIKASIYQVGVSVPVTEKGSVLVSFGENKTTDGGEDFKDRVFSLGYDHFLSKRTDVYAVFSNNTQSNTDNNESGQTFAVGIKHAF